MRCTFGYTHLEVNGMLWEADGARFCVDPIAGQLNFFGLPALYRADGGLAEDEVLRQICDFRPDAILLTQGLDDHTHIPTLETLFEELPGVRFIVAPSAVGRLGFVAPEQICVLRPGNTAALQSGAELKGSVGEEPNQTNYSDRSSVRILAKFKNFRSKIKTIRNISTFSKISAKF